MSGNSSRVLPVVPATVSINNAAHSPTSLIWAGFQFTEAYMLTGGKELHVPWVALDTGDKTRHILRSRFSGYRFARAMNGSWVLVLET